MKKRLTAFLLSLALVFIAFPGNVYAQGASPLQTNTITLENETFTYNYRVENDMVVYVEIDDHIIERIDNIIYVDGNKAATISVISSSSKLPSMNNNSTMPRSGWIWSENGNDSLYTYYGERTVDVALEAAYAVSTVATLAGIIVTFLPINYLAQQAAVVTIDFVSGLATGYLYNNHLYYHEVTYRHAYLGLSYAKKLDISLNLERDLSKPIPWADYTIYGSWG